MWSSTAYLVLHAFTITIEICAVGISIEQQREIIIRSLGCYLNDYIMGMLMHEDVLCYFYAADPSLHARLAHEEHLWRKQVRESLEFRV